LDEEGSWSLLALPVYQNPMLIYGSATSVPTLFGKSYMDQWHSIDEIIDELEGMRGTGDYEDVIKRCAELGRTLRELLKEGEDEDQV
jgi:hypothetical protein